MPLLLARLGWAAVGIAGALFVRESGRAADDLTKLVVAGTITAVAAPMILARLK